MYEASRFRYIVKISYNFVEVFVRDRKERRGNDVCICKVDERTGKINTITSGCEYKAAALCFLTNRN